MDNQAIPPNPSQIEIVHAVRGRVRVRILSDRRQDLLNAMVQQLQGQDGIETVRANQQVGSLTITFDESIVSLSQLKKQLQTWGKLPALDSPSIPENATSWKERGSQAWTQLQSFIPLIVGLAATKGLKLQGWKAIAAYLLSANLTRAILEQLTPEDSELSESDRPKIIPRQLPAVSPPYMIVHAIPGRIRLRIPQVRQNADFGKKLERLPVIDDRVIQVRINYTTGSVVISYNRVVSSNSQNSKTQNSKTLSSTSWLIDLIELIAVPETSEEEEESS